MSSGFAELDRQSGSYGRDWGDAARVRRESDTLQGGGYAIALWGGDALEGMGWARQLGTITVK